MRFPFEFEGGHIRGAKNMTTKEEIDQLLFSASGPLRRVCIVIHCEFSRNRGPAAWSYIREKDRQILGEGISCSGLFYPGLYVLDGGYRAFYKNFPVSLLLFWLSLGFFFSSWLLLSFFRLFAL